MTDTNKQIEEILSDMKFPYSVPIQEGDSLSIILPPLALEAIETLVKEARIDELKNIPRTRSKQAYIEQRLATLTSGTKGKDNG